MSTSETYSYESTGETWHAGTRSKSTVDGEFSSHTSSSGGRTGSAEELSATTTTVSWDTTQTLSTGVVRTDVGYSSVESTRRDTWSQVEVWSRESDSDGSESASGTMTGLHEWETATHGEYDNTWTETWTVGGGGSGSGSGSSSGSGGGSTQTTGGPGLPAAATIPRRPTPPGSSSPPRA